jgi:hypothetical protein
MDTVFLGISQASELEQQEQSTDAEASIDAQYVLISFLINKSG